MKTWQQVRSILTDRDVFCTPVTDRCERYFSPFDNTDKVEINKGECALLFPAALPTDSRPRHR